MAAKAPVGMLRCDQQHPHSTEHHWQLPFAPAPPHRDGKGAQVDRNCCQGPWAACSSLHADRNLDALPCSWLGETPSAHLLLGRARQVQHMKSGRISAVKVLGSRSQMGKRGTSLGDQLPSARAGSALAFTSHQTILPKSLLQPSQTRTKDTSKVTPPLSRSQYNPAGSSG